MIKADLNLLRVFDIVMEVRSVSRAADRLGLTQSAVSHALARLREQLADPLFVRQRGGLAPTQRAYEIAPGVRDGLNRLRDAIAESGFDPGSTAHVFTISASGYFSLTLLPILLARLRDEAPHAQLRIVEPAIDLRAGFEDGSLDFAFGSFGRKPSTLSRTALFNDEMVWVGRAGSRRDDLERRPRLSLASPLFPARTDHSATRGATEPRMKQDHSPARRLAWRRGRRARPRASGNDEPLDPTPPAAPPGERRSR